MSVDLNTDISNMVEHMEEILLNLGLTLLQICRNSNSSKLSCKKEEDQIENEGARLFTRFLLL